MKKQRPVGRPPIPKKEALSKTLQVRTTKLERAGYEKAAENEGLSLSGWIRQALQNAAK
jgi:predicted HicB family RNase H-like nuclease